MASEQDIVLANPMFHVGQHVTYRHVSRGGYGYVTPVDAEIVRFTSAGRVTIRVKKASGQETTINVTTGSLKAKGK